MHTLGTVGARVVPFDHAGISVLKTFHERHSNTSQIYLSICDAFRGRGSGVEVGEPHPFRLRAWLVGMGFVGFSGDLFFAHH